jgi:hypothetical protein
MPSFYLNFITIDNAWYFGPLLQKLVIKKVPQNIENQTFDNLDFPFLN